MASMIEERYLQLHPKSALMSDRSVELFPDGVTHDGRKFSPFRVYMDHGLGPRKWDIDDNEYIDYRTGHGAMILGQAHPAIVKAVSEQVAKGTHLSASTEMEVKWGTLVKELVPSAERLRFVSSGTEAMMMTFRMARSHSGKSKVVKFEGAFHGWADGPFVGAANDSPEGGIPPQVRETMIVLPYDIAAVERTLDEDDDIAAVVFQGNQVIHPSFLEQLRDVTRQKGVILIFDEVVSGFRFSRGGCQGLYNVIPDLTGMAKILAGGLPGGCVAGRADIVNTVGPGRIAHPGTFNANPLSAAAGRGRARPVGQRADQRDSGRESTAAQERPERDPHQDGDSGLRLRRVVDSAHEAGCSARVRQGVLRGGRASDDDGRWQRHDSSAQPGHHKRGHLGQPDQFHPVRHALRGRRRSLAGEVRDRPGPGARRRQDLAASSLG